MDSTLKAEDRAHREILNLIIQHKFSPGEIIMEADLTTRLEMSRTPVRAALGRLATEGLIEKHPGTKSYIIPPVTPEDLRQIVHVRSILESDAASEAALYASADEKKRLLEILAQENSYDFSQNSFDYSAFSQYFEPSQRLHFAIADICHNAYLKRFILPAYWRSQLYFYFFDSFSFLNRKKETNPIITHLEKSVEEHNRIVGVIVKGDSEGARIAMKEHIATTMSILRPF
ncbi:MAG: GntR family transcriptional regulator [Synergistales bacterium]|nr:GntR family transcriptional regulator [Synergistales bacterium]